ncbi:MAG TPA: hypothetical protein VHF92_18190 [Geodermatophilus sp.]|nr:hypothetical protein [Geodermatophilus sp.]
MTGAILVLLLVAALGGLGLAFVRERVRPAWAGGVLVLLLAAAGVLAWLGEEPDRLPWQVVAVAGVLAAVAGGGPVATAVLRAADPTAAAAAGGPGDPEVLRGGTWIGVFERAAVAATLLGGWPEGLAVVLAVKGLGRYAELKAPAAAERFIIGTLASALWAAACVGVVVLLRP